MDTNMQNTPKITKESKNKIRVEFERTIHNIFLSDYSEEGTPVPIPNTEVKLFNADDSS